MNELGQLREERRRLQLFVTAPFLDLHADNI